MIDIRKLLINVGKKFNNFGGLKPFVWLGNIFGIFSCKLMKKRLLPGGIIVRCYIFIIFGARTYFGIDGLSSFLSVTNDLVNPILVIAMYVTQFVALTVDTFTAAFLEKRFVKFFHKLAVYDETVAKLGQPRKDRYAIYWLFIILTMAFAIDVSMSNAEAMENQAWTEIALKNMYLLLQPVTRALSIFKFDLLVHLMYQRFRHLNESIMPNVSWTRELTPTNMSSVNINDVMFLHATLLDASRIMNDTYSLMLLCWFSNLFFSTVWNIYLLTNGDTIRTMIAYYASTFVLAVTTCAVCNITAEEANNAGKNMAKDEPTLIDHSTSMARVRMQLYLVHNAVVFSAADLFVINLPLFYSMIVAIATYGILMQKIYKPNV